MKKLLLVFSLILCIQFSFAQTDSFAKVNFLLGKWTGNGSGFGNNKSTIESSFNAVMDGKYIEVVNDSKFGPTEKKPEGEHHIDNGFISFDKQRKMIIYRQFNSEGFINQYVLNDSLSNDNILIFETENIENFMPGGSAKWTIKKINQNEIETIFDVTFPDGNSTCFGQNSLKRSTH